MLAVFNAVGIFRAAQATIGFAPLNGVINIEKKHEAGDVNVQQEMSLGLTAGRTITMSAKWWGEGIRTETYIVNNQEQVVHSIDRLREATDPHQYRAWLVLHEINHVMVMDRATVISPGQQDRQFSDWQIEVRKEGFPQFGAPTRYAYSNDAEYIVEAMTGTMWNAGYSSVGYDPSAGGRYLRNVSDIKSYNLHSLEEWVITTILK